LVLGEVQLPDPVASGYRLGKRNLADLSQQAPFGLIGDRLQQVAPAHRRSTLLMEQVMPIGAHECPDLRCPQPVA
jgi:hypothetical protein